ncbi:hypothetical protein ACIHDR_48635 [Nocardia sp. NPDC052278]|uniref:hypothetical protein n=1 Tax=unclassified Nocardia TaxID=2637762 RepID=UPI0036A73B41
MYFGNYRTISSTFFVKAATIVFASAVAPLITMPVAADAASTPAATCGPGFYEIDHHDLPLATIHLFYNGSENCMVTWKTAYIGTPAEVNTSIELAGQPSTKVVDGRNHYKYYAGPVKISARGKCIQWEGEAQKPGNIATIDNCWQSGSSHCG